jgi:transposase-like protein
MKPLNQCRHSWKNKLIEKRTFFLKKKIVQHHVCQSCGKTGKCTSEYNGSGFEEFCQKRYKCHECGITHNYKNN